MDHTPPRKIDKSKRRFIKDSIWGSIEYFPWESELLQHPLVNRLHNISQNSTTHYVYPGLKYSRFVHSVGTMHVTTQMFTNLVINSRTELDDRLTDFQNLQVDENMVSIIIERTRCPKEYAIALGVARIAALLHDIGHLPYSHIFEYALSEFLSDTSDLELRLDSNNMIDDLRKSFQEVFNRVTNNMKVHEKMGQYFIRIILQDSKQNNHSYTPFLEGVSQMYSDEKFPIIKKLINAVIDVDRIDFVVRNGFYSGLFSNNPTNLDRLLSFYVLSADNDVPRPDFSRAMSEIESLIWYRFISYEHIIGHHKVHLFDELLERLLFYAIADGSLLDLLEIIKGLLTISVPIENLELFVSEVNNTLNDAYVEALLRQIHSPSGALSTRLNELRKRTLNDDEEKESKLIQRRLDIFKGFFTHRDTFRTLFKRDKQYYEAFEIEIDKDTKLDVTPQSLAEHIKPQKYELEDDLSQELGRTVILGDLSKKIGFGIKDKEARSYGLHEMSSFLHDKRKFSMPYNVWYYSESRENDPELEKRLIQSLRDMMKSHDLIQIH